MSFKVDEVPVKLVLNEDVGRKGAHYVAFQMYREHLNDLAEESTPGDNQQQYRTRGGSVASIDEGGSGGSMTSNETMVALGAAAVITAATAAIVITLLGNRR
jgi:hypothetical protein